MAGPGVKYSEGSSDHQWRSCCLCLSQTSGPAHHGLKTYVLTCCKRPFKVLPFTLLRTIFIHFKKDSEQFMSASRCIHKWIPTPTSSSDRAEVCRWAQRWVSLQELGNIIVLQVKLLKEQLIVFHPPFVLALWACWFLWFCLIESLSPGFRKRSFLRAGETDRPGFSWPESVQHSFCPRLRRWRSLQGDPVPPVNGLLLVCSGGHGPTHSWNLHQVTNVPFLSLL